jgi:isocitrate dehydrogenase
MTKDLAICIHGSDTRENHYLTTEDFLDALDKELSRRLA